MKIRSVEFVQTVVDPRADLPSGLPQIAFVGRSNVGKSSLVNVLLERTRRKIAHVSATPGKTQGLNYYRVNDAFFLVDLPGYGFAKAPESVRTSWRRLTDGYLARPDGPAAVVLLLDLRREPSKEDLAMLDRLSGAGIPTLVVLTKSDKLAPTRAKDQVAHLTRSLGLDPEQVVPFSSLTGAGRELLLEAIEGIVEEASGEDERHEARRTRHGAGAAEDEGRSEVVAEAESEAGSG